VEVPGAKVVFTVKVPAELARRVRRAAKATGQTISAVVSQALAEFLDRPGEGRGPR
jgi:predicted transcriptional regulator